MSGVWYLRWWGFSLNEGGTPVNLHMQWLRPHCWFFVYAYAFGRRANWMWKRRTKMKIPDGPKLPIEFVGDEPAFARFAGCIAMCGWFVVAIAALVVIAGLAGYLYATLK